MAEASTARNSNCGRWPRLGALPGAARFGSVAEAVRLIRAGDTVASSGLVGVDFAVSIAAALEELYLRPDEPGAPPAERLRDLALI